VETGLPDPSTAAIPIEPDAEAILAAPVRAEPPEPVGWSDPITGTDGPHFWDRIVTSEAARVRRYQRPVTVGLAEVIGLDRVAIQWGPQVVDRILVAMGRTISREIRTSDHVARVEPTRFAILLTETDEVAAINCLERVRTACELELGAAGGDVRIALGWASPINGDLRGAIDLAARRLAAEVRHPA
jgi:diguanylate cyclase (GGDEF)-like protein